MRRVPHRGAAELALGEAPHGDHPPACGERLDERSSRFDLGPGRGSVREGVPGPVWVSGDEFPEQNPFGEVERCEDAPHDRRRRFGRAGSRQLALGGEGYSGDARATVAGGLPDEQK